MDTSFDTYKQAILDDANAKIKLAYNDYMTAKNDCRHGVYDKWFRYHRKDDGHAYDLGWMEQNKATWSNACNSYAAINKQQQERDGRNLAGWHPS